MMATNRPRGRVKNVTNNSKGVKKRGEGLGTGPVGSTGGSVGGSNDVPSGGGRATRAGGKKNNLLTIIIIVVLLLGGGGGATGLLSSLLGGGSGTSDNSSGIGSVVGDLVGGLISTDTSGNSGGSDLVGDLVGSLVGGDSSGLGNLAGNLGGLLGNLNSGSTSSGWELSSNTGKLNGDVDIAARDKRTVIKGKGKDEVTIMVYMCGTDLESKYGMGTSDLQEMLGADLGDNVNLIVYTGGCKQWKNNVISSSDNQIYQVVDGELKVLDKDAGEVAMTDPDTLVDFIKYCDKKFPANRNMLIFWDHGGGSISGYGYDEKFARTGSMNLAEINQALKEADVTFDFIGFDACLMATLETALMLTPYADYMIASEETEPGVGWYYTDWLTALGEDTSMPTIEIGKNIVDDFVETCAKKCQGQKTTLSVVDLAELEMTVPEELAAFSKSASELIKDNEYQTVSDARYNTREFAQSSAIDQVDLAHLAQNLGTDEGKELAEALLSAVKYNRTSSNMTNAYGLSIYFPYKKASSVDEMVDTYEAIGMDSEYARCIQEFASMEVSGQAVTGGTTSALPSLLGSLLGGVTGSTSSNSGSDMVSQMLGSFLSGQLSNIVGMDKSNTNFLSERSMSDDAMAQYLSDNYFDASALMWTENANGQRVLSLSEKQWSLVHTLELNMFYDDGEGFIDLGLDNVFEFDENGALIGDTDRTWLAINGQPVAYYYLDTVDDGTNYTITGYVPALLNGERVELMLVFDNANPYGYISGARPVYAEGETETVAKGLTEINVGDTLDFICDYYSYEGEYQDSYFLGEQMVVTENMEISNVDVGEGKVKVTYRFTDIYNQQYWTPAFTQ
ncbi:MAG: peptidase C11 [Lachnospiraceae bacterium]|nr:peptidase C11 [Lachnospiraceae bacterium]